MRIPRPVSSTGVIVLRSRARHSRRRGGTRIGHKGRSVSREQFTIPVATWRGGPCCGDLVIRKTWDTGLPETTFKVVVEGQEAADWTIPKIEGKRRWVDVFYVIPQSVIFPNDDKGRPKVKGSIGVSLSTEKATPSYGYACLITKDWQILGDEYAGTIETGDREWGKEPAEHIYVRGIEKVGQGDYQAAIDLFGQLDKGNEKSDLARLARRMMRAVRIQGSRRSAASSRDRQGVCEDALSAGAVLHGERILGGSSRRVQQGGYGGPDRP